jgi:hypothetical protein
MWAVVKRRTAGFCTKVLLPFSSLHIRQLLQVRLRLSTRMFELTSRTQIGNTTKLQDT